MDGSPDALTVSCCLRAAAADSPDVEALIRDVIDPHGARYQEVPA